MALEFDAGVVRGVVRVCAVKRVPSFAQVPDGVAEEVHAILPGHDDVTGIGDCAVQELPAVGFAARRSEPVPVKVSFESTAPMVTSANWLARFSVALVVEVSVNDVKQSCCS